MNKFSMLDIILFPKDIYGRITNKKLTLYLGILFVGIVDMVFFAASRYTRLFEGKTHEAMTYNAALICVFILVIGFLDVIFFSYPLFDFLKILNKQREAADDGILITKVMKIYITVHFLVIPFNALFFYLLRNIDLSTAADILVVAVLLVDWFLIPVWFSAAVVRGLGTVYDFDPILKRLILVIIFSWNYILGFIFSYIKDVWILALFK